MRIIAYSSILASYAALVVGLPQLGGKAGGKAGGKVNCQGDMAGGLNSLGGVTKV
jgi:hypothetical protein